MLVVLAVLLVAVGLAAASWVGLWLAHDRERLQQLASEALGMEVRIDGSVQLRLGREPGVHVRQLTVRARGSDFIVASDADIGVSLTSVLRRQVRIASIALDHASIAVRQERDGRLNFDTQASSDGEPMQAVRVSLRQAALEYVNDKNGNTVRASGCRVTGSVATDAGTGNALGRLDVKADASCDQVQTQQWQLSRVTFSLVGQNGKLQFKPVTLEAYGGKGSAQIEADLRGSEPQFVVHYELSDFRLEQLSQTITPKKIGEGGLTFSTDLTLRGSSVEAMIQSSQGHASLRGEHLTLQVGDLDQELSRYESSQHFNLVDVGAVLAVGPLGLLVTKGYDFTRLLNSGGQSSQVSVLRADWQIQNGVAQARDVAMTTPANRLALTGGLDFVHRSYQDVTVALVNDQGCARVKQIIRGPFSQPAIDKPNIVSALIGPAQHLIGKAKHLLGARCEVFYSGSLPSPAPAS